MPTPLLSFLGGLSGLVSVLVSDSTALSVIRVILRSPPSFLYVTALAKQELSGEFRRFYGRAV